MKILVIRKNDLRVGRSGVCWSLSIHPVGDESKGICFQDIDILMSMSSVSSFENCRNASHRHVPMSMTPKSEIKGDSIEPEMIAAFEEMGMALERVEDIPSNLDPGWEGSREEDGRIWVFVEPEIDFSRIASEGVDEYLKDPCKFRKLVETQQLKGRGLRT